MSTTIKSLKTKIKVTFFISEEATRGAKEIYLWCEHNGWSPIPLVKSTAKTTAGSFSTSIDLPKEGLKDRYEYRFQYFMEDGSSIFDNDWNADGYCPTSMGNDNSYFNTKVAEPEVEAEAEPKKAAPAKAEGKPAAKTAAKNTSKCAPKTCCRSKSKTTATNTTAKAKTTAKK
ncbi:MAG: hypothetical protein U0L03_07565 [Succinivibrionaceae bacterium]|nr:hypothetical protein [Succinivibrionaceae bacterium]